MLPLLYDNKKMKYEWDFADLQAEKFQNELNKSAKRIWKWNLLNAVLLMYV